MKVQKLATLLLASLATGCGAVRVGVPATPPAAYTVYFIALPGAPPEGVFMDYLAYDRIHKRVWVPAGNTGSVDVVEIASGRVARVRGFPTAKVDWHGTQRTVGPSSATAGDGMVYVGNRGDSSVCAIDAGSLRVGPCLRLDSAPDGLAYVATTKEVWATTPRNNSIAVIGTAAAGVLTLRATIRLDGQPEGFAVDARRGVFYTNLEDKDRTLIIDVATRQVVRAWQPGCGAGGPKGLALDHGFNFLLVACRDRVQVLDAGHHGERLSTIAAGDGVDNIDYVESRHELYAAAARAARLTMARLDAQGRLTPLAAVATAAGARNAVATEEGTAYVTDSPEGKLVVVAPAGAH